jgi:hypothetical protein
MAAISTLLNPLAPADDDLLTFWNNDSGDLVLGQRKEPKKPTDLIWIKTARQTGIVKNPSSIVALQYQGLVCIARSRRRRCLPKLNASDRSTSTVSTSGENPTLKRLSPTVERLKDNIPITQFASLAGAVNEDSTQGWLYYLAYVPIFFYSCRGSRSTCSHVTQD